MTRNQIDYNKLLEERRSNRKQEALTEMRDQRSHQVALLEYGEKQRHNYATEQQARDDLAERMRNLDVTSAISRFSAEESARHNKALEELQGRSVAETERANRAKESETHRSNLASEAIRRTQNAIDSRRVDLGYSQLDETIRSNQARELLTSQELAEIARANLAREIETNRHNTSTEIELNRHNIASEDIGERANVIDTRNAATKEYEAKSGRIQAWARVFGTTDDVARAITSINNLIGGSTNGSRKEEIQERKATTGYEVSGFSGSKAGGRSQKP